MTMPFVVTYSFEAVLKDGLSGFQNSRPYVVKASKLFSLKIYFQTYSSVESSVSRILISSSSSSGSTLSSASSSTSSP